MTVVNLSLYQISRLIALVDIAISANERLIKTHDYFLRSLSEDELANLDNFDLRYSDILDEDNSILRELKLCLERGSK